jgi:MFS family permease
MMAAGSIGAREWKTLFAAQLGWMLDGMDVMLYAFAIATVQAEFGLTSAMAGAIASCTLITSAVGGGAAGYFADRYGRARVLMWSILIYSVFTGITATSRTVWELVLWRGMVGLGLGAEWSAGTVLVSETWPARHRGKAIGFVQGGWALGYIIAAGLAAILLPRYGWRVLFGVGVLPALLAFWVRRNIEEPEVWKRASPAASRGAWHALAVLAGPAFRSRAVTVSSICALILFAYWGLFTWIPVYLSSPVERGGAGLGIVKSFGWVVAVQVGAFSGYMTCGLIADRIGRRPAFALFTLGAAVLVPLYAYANAGALLALGPLLGFFGHGYFSIFGSMLAELFPSTIRGTAQGICYNSGRIVSAFAPVAVGALADKYGLGAGLALTSAFFAAGAVLVRWLPETRGRQLE